MNGDYLQTNSVLKNSFFHLNRVCMLSKILENLGSQIIRITHTMNQ